jgi:hypothetical protein
MMQLNGYDELQVLAYDTNNHKVENSAWFTIYHNKTQCELYCLFQAFPLSVGIVFFRLKEHGLLELYC